MLYASAPATLPEAYARLSTIMNDREWIKFANQFNTRPIPRQIIPGFREDNRNQGYASPFEPRNIREVMPRPEPMDVNDQA